MSHTRHARELAVVLVLYGLLAVAATWPLVRDFGTRVIGDVAYDQRHAIWILWHVEEALLGRQSWFSADLLFHPHGASTLVDGVGPVSGFLALPFSSGGPLAAYNGATLLGFALSGFCMYALVRYGAGLGLGAVPRVAAFLAGVVFMMWPIHVAGLYGHLEKVFVGLLPLNVLAGLLAYDPARSRRWLVAPAVTLLLTLLHNGNQFTFALLALVLLAGLGLVTHTGETRRSFVARVLASGAIALLVNTPLLLEVARVMRDPTLEVALGYLSAYYAPDLLQLIVPSIHQAIGDRLFYDDTVLSDFTRRSLIDALSPRPGWYGSGIETAVTIPVTLIPLMVVAWVGRQRGTRVWLLFGGVFSVLALGPVLQIAGVATVPLPYQLLAKVPGFDVMRTPGRFMMIASVGFAVVAALGLTRLMERMPRHALGSAALVAALVLIECWPRPWPQQVPPPVPEFYAQLERDAGGYAVLDLPSGRRNASYSSAYQYYQLTHRKPIAWGYLSRQYVRYPIRGLSGILDDRAPNATGTRRRLVRLGYRYVVWHKRAGELFGNRRPERIGDGQLRSAPADAQSNAFLRKAFAGERPIVDDDLVTVYRLDRVDPR